MSFEEHTSKFFESSYDGKYLLFQCSIILLWHCQLQEKQATSLPSWMIHEPSWKSEAFYGQDKLCSCSHKHMHCTNAFCILFVHEVGYQTVDQSGLMVCAWLCNIYNSNLCSQWTCAVLWHCKVNPCGVWHQCSLFLKYKHRGVSHYPSQSVSLMAVWMGKPFLRRQRKMVANSLK